MNNKTCLLHISDLHRSRGGEISNNALLSSLISDRDKYTSSESPRIQEPDLIIVSGDIVRGSTSVTNSDTEVHEQYAEAKLFLTDLANEFLHGKKSNIIIIPGNHDVDFKYSRASMEKLKEDQILNAQKKFNLDILTDSLHPRSLTRWSWKELSFYKISDLNTYLKRLEAFANFYSDFYDGKRQYSLRPEDQFDIFDYPDHNLTIAAYNSCYNNDHLRFVGDIHPDCLAKSSIQLRKYKSEEE